MNRLTHIIAIMIALIMIFSGCEAHSKEVQGSRDNGVITQLSTMIEQKNKPKEMLDYLNQNIKGLTKPAATEALGILLNAMEEYETIYNDKIIEGNNSDLMFKYFQSAFDYSLIESITEQEFKGLLSDIVTGGYKIASVEDTYVVFLDYDSLKTFNEYIDDEIKTYIEIMSLRYSDSDIEDAELKMEAKELETRILQMENYILTYTNEQREEIILSMYEGHIMVYMSSLDNTPLFDNETETMNVGVFNKLEDSASRNKDNVFGKIISKYVQLLKQESYTNTAGVQDFVINVNNIIAEQLDRVKTK